ncbi:hypothetical protein F4692_000414 [Nocardioides cavernae]|uniref:Uncharacterized protein n=1 Tax=Nocardioides cavernae TaxID=1921566 RepID=A0A7Y9H022_9ACTN|nr:hypothetical protein [Nocardioides cavernae]NYE35310.1 hypothetical protein [Nocardioides cavernae]
MRIRGALAPVAACTALAGLLATPAGAVPVEVGQHTIFDTRVPGMPTTADGARTLRAVSAETDWRTGEVELTATLGSAVPAFSEVSVTWHLGRWSPSGSECAPEKTVTATAIGDGYDRPVTETRVFADLARDYTCLDVSLTTQREVTDRMRDGWTTAIAYSGAEADLAAGAAGSTERTTVLAGRPTPAIVLVTSHVLPSATTTVTGSGAVRIEPFEVTGLAADEVRPVVARVTAPRGRSTLSLRARDERGDPDYDGSSPVAAVRASGRPDAGRFTGDGVRLRVDAKGRVRSLVALVGTCSSPADVRARLRDVVRLPRSGAAAVARRVGKGWTAVQVVTLADHKVTGVVVRTTPGCTRVVPFVARRR